MGEKLVPLVERGELRLAHDGPLLTQAQPAGVGAGVVGGQPGQDPHIICMNISAATLCRNNCQLIG